MTFGAGHLRKIYRTRLQQRFLLQWRLASADLADHRDWKVQVRAEHKAKKLHSFHRACREHRRRRDFKKEQIQVMRET